MGMWLWAGGGLGLCVVHGPKELLRVGRASGALSQLSDAGGAAINLSPLASTPNPLIWAISKEPEFYEIS